MLPIGHPSVPSGDLRALLDHLSAGEINAPGTWDGWQIVPVTGGSNNRLFRTMRPGADLVVKFTLRDARRRAEREYSALCLLRDVPRPVAPAPVWLDIDTYPLPVVVQTWLDGPCHSGRPESDEDWLRLLQTHALAHLVRPQNADPALAAGVLRSVTTAHSPAEGLALVREQVARLPATHGSPPELARLARCLEDNLRAQAGPTSAWANVPDALCHVDGNLANFIRRPDGWLAVDWENSGWGDPAFEIADLLAHPALFETPAGRRGWVFQTYARLTGNRTEAAATAARIHVYYRIMLVWWVARMARYLYEIPRRLDERLVARPAGWQADLQEKYQRYLAAAEAEFDCR